MSKPTRHHRAATIVGRERVTTSEWPAVTLFAGAAGLRPASEFTWEELTLAYNQTRIDYIVPMPMNVARLREYVHSYDVNLRASVAAVDDGQITGLAMLGVRIKRTWITRLGVLPTNRQHGMGQLLMEYLIAQSHRLDADSITLEVIRGNLPAHRLFVKLGFQETRELLVLRRPPGRPRLEVGPYHMQILDTQQTVDLLAQRRQVPSWLDETPSLVNAGLLAGLDVQLRDGSHGWIAYQNKLFQLGHLVLCTEAGDPQQVGRVLLHALYSHHPAHDTMTENLPVDDPHLSAMREMNYLEAFRRIEMKLDL
jgi:ribosomal protein S18 acetylase RimI-like enzyme